MAAIHLGGKVLVLTVDPAKRLANALGLEQLRQRRDPGARRGVRRRRASSRAASCGRRCSTPSSRGTTSSAGTRPTPKTRDAILANPLYQNLIGPVRAEPRLHRHGAALRDPHAPARYDLIVVDTPPTRNAIDFLEAPARMADFFSQPAAALAHRAGPHRGGELRVEAVLHGGRSHPRLAVPPGHRRVLHAVPVDVRRLRRAGRRPSTRVLARPAHDVRRRVDARVGAGARGRVLHRASCARASSTSAPSCSTRCCRRTCSTARPRRRRPARRRRQDRGPVPPATAPTAQVARVLREVGESFLNFQVVASARPRAGRAGGRPRGRRRVPYFDSDIYDLAGWSASASRSGGTAAGRPSADAVVGHASTRRRCEPRRCDHGVVRAASPTLQSTSGSACRERPALELEFGFPTPCPECGGRGYLDQHRPQRAGACTSTARPASRSGTTTEQELGIAH